MKRARQSTINMFFHSKRWLQLALCCCCVVITYLLLTSRRASVSRRQVAAAASAVVTAPTCTDLFRLSTCRQRWEVDTGVPTTCSARTLTPTEVHECVTASSAAWPVRLAFVGDSRLQNIFKRTLRRLHLPTWNRTFELPLEDPAHFANSNIKRPSATCFELFMLPIPFHGEPTSHKPFCSLRGGGDWLRLDYWWRVYLSRSFRAKVDELVDECAASAARCPRLVVLDSGLWYARRFDITDSASAADWMLRYRADLAALLPSLRRLAAATRVLWKIDEPQFRDETNQGKPGILMAELGTIHAIVYGMMAGIANVTVWSAMVPSSVEFNRRVCWVGRRMQREFERTLLFAECSNMNHVGATLLDGHVTQLLNFLCSGSKAFGPEHCCGMKRIAMGA